MVAEEMNSIVLPDALGQPFRRATGISWRIVPLIKKVAQEDRQIRRVAADSSLDPREVVCLVNVGNNDNLFAGLHARVMGALPVGRKFETDARRVPS